MERVVAAFIKAHLGERGRRKGRSGTERTKVTATPSVGKLVHRPPASSTQHHHLKLNMPPFLSHHTHETTGGVLKLQQPSEGRKFHSVGLFRSYTTKDERANRLCKQWRETCCSLLVLLLLPSFVLYQRLSRRTPQSFHSTERNDCMQGGCFRETLKKEGRGFILHFSERLLNEAGSREVRTLARQRFISRKFLHKRSPFNSRFPRRSLQLP